jgi:hypothetical protein
MPYPQLVYSVPALPVWKFRQALRVRVIWARFFMNIRMAAVASANTNDLLCGIEAKKQLNAVVNGFGNGTPSVHGNGVKDSTQEKPEHTTLENITNESDASELYKVSASDLYIHDTMLNTRHHSKPSSSSKVDRG